MGSCVATSIVRGITNAKVTSLAASIPVVPKRPVGRPRQATPLVPLGEATEEQLSSLSARQMSQFLAECEKIPGMGGLPNPRDKEARKAVLIWARNKHWSLVNAAAPNS